MRLATRLLVSTLGAVMLASSALADNGDCRLIRGASTTEITSDDVSVCRQDTWIHQGGTKLGNAAGLDQDTFPSWNTTMPTASISGGSGGGYVANSAFHQLTAPQDPRGSGVFKGTYTGVLDTIGVNLYALMPGATGEVNIALTIGGEPIYGSSQEVKVVSAGNFQKISFAFVNLHSVLEGLGLSNAPDTQHAITLAVNGTYAINDTGVFVYDSAEAPAGLLFNLENNKMTPYTKLEAGG